MRPRFERVRSAVQRTVAAGLVAGTLAGCAESSFTARARGELEASFPGARFEKQVAMHFGRLTTAMMKPVARWALREDDEDMDVLRRIRRIDIAIYEVRSFPGEVGGATLTGLEDALGGKDWDRLLRTREDGEVTWIFNRERDGEITDLFVVTVDGAEMVMVRVGGRLDRMLADLIADDPGGFGASLGG